MIAAAAYQSGQTLFSQYTGTWESGEHEGRIDHTEILLPPNAPHEYADRETLWNAVDAAETGENAQTARWFIIVPMQGLLSRDQTQMFQEIQSAGLLLQHRLNEKPVRGGEGAIL